MRIVLLLAVMTSAHVSCLPYQADRLLPDYCQRDFFREGKATTRSVREFENDRIARETLYFFNEDGEFYPAGITELTYNDAGDLEVELFDNDADGAPNFRHESSYEGGLLSRKESFDLDNEGALSTVRVYEYDEADLLVRVERDNEADGIFDDLTEHSYDEHGQRTETTVDGGMDGEIERRTTFTWESGLVVRQVDELPDDRVITIDFSHDSHGNLVREDWDEHPDTYGVYDYSCW